MSPHLWERLKTAGGDASWQPPAWTADLSVVLDPGLAPGEWRVVDSHGDETERGVIE